METPRCHFGQLVPKAINVNNSVAICSLVIKSKCPGSGMTLTSTSKIDFCVLKVVVGGWDFVNLFNSLVLHSDKVWAPHDQFNQVSESENHDFSVFVQVFISSVTGGTWFSSSKSNQMSCQSGRNVLRRSQHVYPMSSACTLSLSALRQLWGSQNCQQNDFIDFGGQNTYIGTHFGNSSSPSKSEAGVRNWAIGSP